MLSLMVACHVVQEMSFDCRGDSLPPRYMTGDADAECSSRLPKACVDDLPALLVGYIIVHFVCGGIPLTWLRCYRFLCSSSDVVLAVLPSRLDMQMFSSQWSLCRSLTVKTSTLAVIAMWPPGLHLDQQEFCEKAPPGNHLALQDPLSKHRLPSSTLDQTGRDGSHSRKM